MNTTLLAQCFEVNKQASNFEVQNILAVLPWKKLKIQEIGLNWITQLSNMTSDCTCPRTLERMVMIEYPGFVKNQDKALATLGGVETIEKVFESQKNRLELKFRKSDPYSHPAYGDQVPRKCLVLRIKKNKDPVQITNSDNCDRSFQISVVGEIQISIRFDTLAEFQWLPMQRINESTSNHLNPTTIKDSFTIKRTPESLNPKYVSILDDVLPIRDPFDNSLKSFNPDAPLLILPAVFSRFDSPREIHLPHPKFRSKEMREEFERQQKLSIIGRTRKKRSTMSYLLSFNDTVPEKPPEKLVKERSPLSGPEKNLIPQLERCFERQSVWSKAALCFELNCSPISIKYILPLIAFHYLNGPFRTLWVKYGYNPHKDKSSKILQTLDFRVKNNQDQHEYSRRSIHQYQLPMRKNSDKIKQLDLKSIITGTSSSQSDCITVTESMWKFRKDLVPPTRQLSYQLKDIEVDDVQMIIHSNDGREQECSERDGWLPEGSIEKIRKIMTRIMSENFDSMISQLSDNTQ